MKVESGIVTGVSGGGQDFVCSFYQCIYTFIELCAVCVRCSSHPCYSPLSLHTLNSSSGHCVCVLGSYSQTYWAPITQFSEAKDKGNNGR